MVPAGAPATALEPAVPAQNKQKKLSLWLWCFLFCDGDVPFTLRILKKLSLWLWCFLFCDEDVPFTLRILPLSFVVVM
jgi:hypothetical protein